MPRDIISEQQYNIEFVKTVEKYPCLYNYTLPTYTRKDISDKAWEQVAEASKMTPSSCRERWRNLRAVFTRTIKQANAGTKKKPYYLAEAMQFVIPFLQPTNMTEAKKLKIPINKSHSETSELNESGQPLEIDLDEIKIENDEETDQEWTIDTGNSSLKRTQETARYQCSKRPLLLQSSSSITIPETNDPVASFINSLMPELREMNTAQFKAFKRRVLVLIDDITTEIPSSQNVNEYISYDNYKVE